MGEGRGQVLIERELHALSVISKAAACRTDSSDVSNIAATRAAFPRSAIKASVSVRVGTPEATMGRPNERRGSSSTSGVSSRGRHARIRIFHLQIKL